MDMQQSLVTQAPGKMASPELLEMLGRQASEMFRTKGIPLNQAIRGLAAEHPELGNEHIKRIVEFANNVTFQSEFETAQDKNVHFQIADPGVVLRDLKDGGTPAHDGKPLGQGLKDYAGAPAAGGQNMTDLNNELDGLFSTGNNNMSSGGLTHENIKTASVRAEDAGCHANPVEDVYDLQVRLEGTRSRLVEGHECMDLMLKEAHENLYQTIRREVLEHDGAGLGGVIGALEKIAAADDVASVMEPIIERLVTERVPNLHASLEKRAGVFINPDHDLVVHWSGLMKVARDKLQAAEAISQVDDGLRQTRAFIKNAASLTTGIRKAISPAHTKVPAALRQRKGV